MVTREWLYSREWFYEFQLPDGTVTPCYLAEEFRGVHETKLKYLRRAIEQFCPNAERLTAMDLACHQGYFTVELAKWFSSVRGMDLRPENIEAARDITEVLGVDNVEYAVCDLENLRFTPFHSADFVLVYGLMYHLANPVRVLHLASQMARKCILIDTQVFHYDIIGCIESGHHLSQTPIQGMFALINDGPDTCEAGPSKVALVPSVGAILSLLTTFGFTDIGVMEHNEDDYEQFRRGHRVVIWGVK